MSRSSSVIEINGNRYDAVSGQLVGVVKKVAEHVKPASGGVIDGFVRRPLSTSSKPIRKAVSHVKTANLQQAGPVRARIKHTAQSVHRGTQRSKTLMRGAVSKPSSSREPGIEKPQSDPVYLSRAQEIQKSSKVRRFGPLSSHNNASQVQPTLIKSKVRPFEPKKTVTSSTATAQPLPSMVTSVSHYQLERLLDHALLKADSHKKSLHEELYGRASPWRRINIMPRWAAISTSLVTVLLLGGFFAWQNIPQVAMRAASMRAHVAGNVPAYTPSGFNFVTPVSYADGSVTISYKGSSDRSKSFNITQQKSNWTSESLQANAIPANTQVQTSQINGTTVYIYGNSNDAVWVNHGYKYSLKNLAKLDSEQILKIAGSM